MYCGIVIMKLVLAAAVIFTAVIQPCVTHSAYLANKVNTNPLVVLDMKGIQSLARYDSKFALSDLWTSIKEKISEAWETIKAVGASLIENTKQWLENLISESEQVIENAKKQLEIYKSEFDAFIKAIQEKAYEIGINIKECTQENQETILKLLTDTLTIIAECVSDKVIAGQKLLESTTQFVELEIDLENMVNVGLEKCANAADIDICLAEFMDEVNGTTMKMSRTFEVLEIENRSILETLGEALQVCLGENLGTIGSQILQQTKIILECVNNKMTSKESSPYLR